MPLLALDLDFRQDDGREARLIEPIHDRDALTHHLHQRRLFINGEASSHASVILTKVRLQSCGTRRSWLWVLTFARMTGGGYDSSEQIHNLGPLAHRLQQQRPVAMTRGTLVAEQSARLLRR